MGHQLALSEAVLACLPETRQPVLRWYVTRQPALVLGNGQRIDAADLAACRESGVSVYKRTSGGTAVLVDENALSMEVALPAGHPLAIFDVSNSYQWIGEIWARALRALGIDAARALPVAEVRALPAVPRDDLIRLACYGTLSPWEVVAGQRKLIGLSQVRRRGGALIQVGAYLHWQPERLAALLALSEGERATLAARLQGAAAGLDDVAGRSLSVRAVVAAVQTSLEDSLGVHLMRGAWKPCERAAARRTERERFQPLAAAPLVR